jgi:hypothetical protein
MILKNKSKERRKIRIIMSAKVKFTFSLRVDENNKHNLTLGSLSLMIYLNKKYVVIYATRVYKALVFFYK